jgi:hypothetical protein
VRRGRRQCGKEQNEINSKDFLVRPGERVNLREWPTIVKPFCESKEQYQKLLPDYNNISKPLTPTEYRRCFVVLAAGRTAER